MVFEREKYLHQIRNAFEFIPIVVLIGSRQVGKTTLMNIFNAGKEHIAINGQNIEEAVLFEKYSIIENYLKIHLNEKLDGFLIIDEFQFISGISEMLKLLTDKNPHLKILASGSSSLDMIQQVNESLAGRIRMINVYSLSFEEYIQFSDAGLYDEYSKYDIGTPSEVINKKLPILLDEYLLFGGMPRVALAKNPADKISLIDDIYQTYLLKDVRSYVRNEDSIGFNKMLRLLAAQISNLVNVNELSRSSGLKYAKVEEYLYLLEQMFIIKLIEPYASNSRTAITKQKKIFFNDIGLRNMIYNSFNDIDIRTDNGAIFENFAYLEIMKTLSARTCNFYRTKDGAEVDFITSDHKTTKSFEVKFKALDKPINTQTIKAFNNKENINESYLVNRNLNGVHGGINYIPGYLISKLR